MPCSEKLSDENIRTIFDMQHLLFERHEEYIPGLLGDYNWQSVEIQSALDKVYSDFDTLAIIRNMPKLIVFSENFFGRHVVRQKQEFETLLKQHTSRFEDTIFAINYLCAEQTDVPIAEVDRTINIIKSSCDSVNFIHDYNINIQQLSNFNHIKKCFIPKDFYDSYQKMCKILNKLIKTTNIIFESNTNAIEYIAYLKNIIQQTKTQSMFLYTLENITSYFYNSNILMRYNKATYFNEINDLEQSNYIYKFGIGIDFVQECSLIANTLHDNVSTEICRDVIVETRKDDKKRHIHIVQSDYIRLNKYFDNLPEYEVLVHADSYNSCLYVEKQAQSQSLEYTIEIDCSSKSCTTRCFMLE